MKKNVPYWLAAFMLAVCATPVAAQTLPAVQQPRFKKDTFNIVRFGAKPDGVTLNTQSINNAIQACSQKGGGVVVIPSGLWITGPLVLKSNVNLHLQQNALLQFTKDKQQYPLVEGNWEGLPQMRNQSPISATGQINIAITGKGIIDGGGEAWRMVKKEKLTESQWKKLVASGGVLGDNKTSWYPSESFVKGSNMKNPGVVEPGKTPEFFNSIKDFLRPNLLVLANCKKILLEGVTFQNSPAWCLHPLMSEDLTVRNITVNNPWYAQNGDGIDVESCKNVLIENSTFDVGDDALCMKSGRDEAGRKRGMPTENVTIRNCTVYHAHGGFVIGSEMSGGVRNIVVTNCTFMGTDIGLRFKSTRGRGGIVEKIYIDGIAMKNIPAEVILFDMYYMSKDPVPLSGEKDKPAVVLQPVTEATPQFRDFRIRNVVCNGAEKGIFIRGLPEMHVKNIQLENMVLQAKHGIEYSEATNVQFKNIRLITKQEDTTVLSKLVDASTGEPQSVPVAQPSWSQLMAATAMSIWKDSFSLTPGRPARWSYDQGVILKGIEGIWRATGNNRYFQYIRNCMDFFVDEQGNIKGYKPDEFNIDHINNGKLLLFLYRETKNEKYKKAADLLRSQLQHHPRTSEGGFWHKKIYPWQMWLDGLYMGQPFYAEYATLFHEDTAFNDITRQFVLMAHHAKDPATGLLYHGWDESKQQRWANKVTGQSPNFWGRAMGWFGMAMVDALDHFPAKHPGRDSIITILNDYAKAIVQYQDPATGTWYDVMDRPNEKRNYHEASASCMMVYTLAKGMRKGYLPASYAKAAQKGYKGILQEFIEKDNTGRTNLKGTVQVSGLGGNPYRDGSFDYYMSEPVIVNDPKGVGAFIKCAVEMELIQ